MSETEAKGDGEGAAKEAKREESQAVGEGGRGSTRGQESKSSDPATGTKRSTDTGAEESMKQLAILEWQLLRDLQRIILYLRFLRQSHDYSIRTLRDDTKEFGEDLRNVRSLDHAVAQINSPTTASAVGNRSSSKHTANNQDRIGDAKRSGIAKGFQDRLSPMKAHTPHPSLIDYSIGYASKQHFRQLLVRLREDPRSLGEALACCIENDLVLTEERKPLAKAIVGDVFGLFAEHHSAGGVSQPGERGLLEALDTMLRELRRRKVRIGANTIVQELFFEYASRVGRKFLQATLLPLISNLATSVSPNAIAGSKSANEAAPSGAERMSAIPGSASHLEAIQKCVSRLLQRILHSLPVVPYGLRVLTKLVYTLDDCDGHDHEDLKHQEGVKTTNESNRPASKSSLFGSLHYFFWDWLIDAILNPDPHQLCRWRPVSSSARTSINHVASVMRKLTMVAPQSARFTAGSSQNLFNEFIVQMRPRVQAFTLDLRNVPERLPPDDGLDPEDYYDDYRLDFMDTITGKGRPEVGKDGGDVLFGNAQSEMERMMLAASRHNKLEPVKPLVLSLHSLRILHSVLSRLKNQSRGSNSEGMPFPWIQHLEKCTLPAPSPPPQTPVGGEQKHRSAYYANSTISSSIITPKANDYGGEAAAFIVLDEGVPEVKPVKFPNQIFTQPEHINLPCKAQGNDKHSKSGTEGKAKWIWKTLNRIASALVNSLGMVGDLSRRPPHPPLGMALSHHSNPAPHSSLGLLGSSLRGEGQKHLRLGRPDLSTLLVELANLLESQESVQAISKLQQLAGDGKSNTRGRAEGTQQQQQGHQRRRQSGYSLLVRMILRRYRLRVTVLRDAGLEVLASHVRSLLNNYQASLKQWRRRLLEAVLDYRVRMILEPLESKLSALRVYAARASTSLSYTKPPPRLLLKGHVGPQKNLMGVYRLVTMTPRSERHSDRSPSSVKGGGKSFPLYRHEKELGYYLYYYAPYGLWLVGSVPGRHHGWLFVNSKSRLPNMIPEGSRWTFWNKEQKKWTIDTKVTVEPIDGLDIVGGRGGGEGRATRSKSPGEDNSENQLELLHRIEDLFTMTPPSGQSSPAGPRSIRDITEGTSPSLEIPDEGVDELEEREGLCRGAWPANLDEDHFLCERCTAILKRHKHMVHRFMNRYAAKPPPLPTHTHAGRMAVSALEAERITPHGARVSVRVADYVIGTIYPSIIVPCAKANHRFSSALNRLAKRFPTFESLYTYMTRGPRKEHKNSGSMEKTSRPFDPAAADNLSSSNNAVLDENLGEVTVRGAATELLRLCEAPSVVEKLEGFSKCKAVLIAALRSPAIFPILSGDHGADAYMPLLSYAILRANPNNLLSHVQFVRLMHPDSLSVKDFVDACVAIKALLNLAKTIPPETPPNPSSRQKAEILAPVPKAKSVATPSSMPRLPPRPDSDTQGEESKKKEYEEFRSRLKESMVREGYQNSSVEFAINNLSVEDFSDEATARAKVRASVADLKHLRNLGYPDHSAKFALLRRANVIEAVAFLERNYNKDSSTGSEKRNSSGIQLKL